MSGYDRYQAGADTYDSGDFYLICDTCGFKMRRSVARKTWDNLMVCPRDFEERHPQDFVRGRKDKIAVADPRPEADNTFVTTNQVQPGDL